MNSITISLPTKKYNKDKGKVVASIYSKQGKEVSAKPNWDLVKKYLPLVKSLTSKMRMYFPEQIDLEDVYSIALSGLIAATQNYNPHKYPAFGTYATIRVRGALLDELRRIDWMSRDQRTKTKDYRKKVSDLEQKLQRSVTDEDIQKELKLSKKEHLRIKEDSRPIKIIPLDMNTGEDADNSLHDLLADANEVDARDTTEKNEVVRLLRDRMKTLPEIHKKILAMYYFKNMRLAEIAIVLKVTESRICQIHAQIVKELRNYLHNTLSK